MPLTAVRLKGDFALIIHGGAGALGQAADSVKAAERDALQRALLAGSKILRNRGVSFCLYSILFW